MEYLEYVQPYYLSVPLVFFAGLAVLLVGFLAKRTKEIERLQIEKKVEIEKQSKIVFYLKEAPDMEILAKAWSINFEGKLPWEYLILRTVEIMHKEVKSNFEKWSVPARRYSDYMEYLSNTKDLLKKKYLQREKFLDSDTSLEEDFEFVWQTIQREYLYAHGKDDASHFLNLLSGNELRSESLKGALEIYSIWLESLDKEEESFSLLFEKVQKSVNFFKDAHSRLLAEHIERSIRDGIIYLNGDGLTDEVWILDILQNERLGNDLKKRFESAAFTEKELRMKPMPTGS